ncbi:hypothetical protein LTR37_008705 [Vermiconidia calcicola]|uniref:Uncharacterized protein n=1 Tax=Vermiconidia calcicola TaxID=1690605 RepID=A0ACC3NBE3_9PEZI|nr:hypothetical protein LTR37_008705 [Vermiconidia calcicola]
MSDSVKKVALLGADGKLGPAVLDTLVAKGFQVTVLKRASSKSEDTYPKGVEVVRIQDDFPIDVVANNLSGQDAMIVTIKGSQTEIQYRLAQACVKAGVKRLIPADFGSCDSSSPKAQELVPLFKRKTELRDQLMDLGKDSKSFSWTSLVCGHFFDWSLEFLHIYLKERKADILDDGETKWSASTLSRIAEATVRILQNLDATSNKMIYIQSFCISQNQVIKAYEKATGSSWEVTKYDSEKYEKEEKRKADDGDLEAVENLVWLLGALDANWESKENFAMKTLGLEDEDMHAAVEEVVKRESKQ